MLYKFLMEAGPGVVYVEADSMAQAMACWTGKEPQEVRLVSEQPVLRLSPDPKKRHWDREDPEAEDFPLCDCAACDCDRRVERDGERCPMCAEACPPEVP